MTGIERLREFVAGISPVTVVCGVTKTSYDREHKEETWARLRDFLSDIADQIEREQDKVAKTDWDTVRKVSADMADRVFMSVTIDELLRDWYRKLNDATDGHVASDSHEARAPFSRMRVLAVVTDMERHCLGHEGMEDSPVAHWARELREALGGDVRDPAADVSVSAYDLLPEEDREAAAWVRKHGGLDYVKSEWRSRVPHDRYERRRQRLLGHIAECETALGRRNERIEKMGKTIEFYQLNNSNFRHLLADVAERLGFTRYGDDYEPEDLLDALDRRLVPEGCEWPRYEDGEPVNLGDRYECWCGETHVVSSVSVRKGCSMLNASEEAHTFVVSDGPLTSHGKRVKRPAPAVLAADLDSWERIEEDKDLNPFGYCKKVGHKLWTFDNAEEFKASDLVRRAKKLAGVDND